MGVCEAIFCVARAQREHLYRAVPVARPVPGRFRVVRGSGARPVLSEKISRAPRGKESDAAKDVESLLNRCEIVLKSMRNLCASGGQQYQLS